MESLRGEQQPSQRKMKTGEEGRKNYKGKEIRMERKEESRLKNVAPKGDRKRCFKRPSYGYQAGHVNGRPEERHRIFMDLRHTRLYGFDRTD